MQGDAGPQGPDGVQGDAGREGPQGLQGPPFASAIVDGVTTLNPGDPATVTVISDGVDVHFSFGIPAGADGVQGPVGEVSNQQLYDAIATTASVAPYTGEFSEPPTQAEMQAFASYVESLRSALER